MKPYILLPLGALLAACSVKPVKINSAPEPLPELSSVYDCLRENRLALVSAHRGQPHPDATENSLTSFAETIERGPLMIEIDVARAVDGTLMLMHDDTLDRTTTGTGRITAHTYQHLRQLYLKDGKGRVTTDRIPTLDEALIWAKRNRTILQIDFKSGVPVHEVVEAIRQNRMEKQVVLIGYSLKQTQTLMKAAPEMMISGSGRNERENEELLRKANSRLLFFTGTSEPDVTLIDKLDRAKVEAITGTLGRPGTRLDDIYLKDGRGTEYAELARRGVAVIASDQPLEAWKALKNAELDGTQCIMRKK